MSAHPRAPGFPIVDREAREKRDEKVAFELLPLRERVLDRLADLMLDANEILGFIETDETGDLRSIASEVEEVFERVNRLMERLSD